MRLLRVAAAAERGLIRPNQGGTAVHTVLEQIAQGRFLLDLRFWILDFGLPVLGNPKS
jgi:hypothetical protein